MNFLVRNPDGFPDGYTGVTRIGEPDADTGINFGILKLRAGKRIECGSAQESVHLLLGGEIEVELNGKRIGAKRESLFDQAPVALHLPRSTGARLVARRDSEFAVLQVENENEFEPRLFDATNLAENEHRGRGILGDTAYRIVRTIFDMRNRPESKLVLGEVINFPGRWSSYPPHHHLQPEIYHYRFLPAQGYGHGELGELVQKIHTFDTVKILDGRDHPQVAAPGYAMYYLWAIRHLPGDPYTVPVFTPEHRWVMDPAALVWKP